MATVLSGVRSGRAEIPDPRCLSPWVKKTCNLTRPNQTTAPVARAATLRAARFMRRTGTDSEIGSAIQIQTDVGL